MTEPAPEYVPPAREPVGPVATSRVARPRPAVGSLIVRILLTLAGAAGLIVGAFLEWLRGKTTTGVDISARVYISTAFTRHPTFFKTAGFVMIVLGLLAILGLAPRTGWLTRLAGALGVIAVILFGIQIVRDPTLRLPGDVGIGVWVCLAGAVVALIGGFFGTRMRYVQPIPAAVPPPAAAP